MDANKLRLWNAIKQKQYNVDINVFGLRQLQSFGLLPIRKPFIKFNVKSLLPPEKAIAVTNIQTEAQPGADPNYNTLLTFNTKLPEDADFCPVLKCEVFDHIFLGFRQPLIGCFSIKLGDIRQRQVENRAEIKKQIAEISLMPKKHFQAKTPIEELKKLKTEKERKSLDKNPEMKKLVTKRIDAIAECEAVEEERKQSKRKDSIKSTQVHQSSRKNGYNR